MELVTNEFFEEKEMDQTTLADFEGLCNAAFNKREEIDELKKGVKVQEEALEQLERKIATVLEAHERQSFQSSRGTVYFHETTSFKLPEGQDNKALFFQHLKEKGIFEDMVSVHSKTLNTYCKKELEAALEDGNVTFKIPGISEPVTIKDVRFRKGK